LTAETLFSSGRGFSSRAKPKRSCTGRTASFGDKALGEKNKRGVVRGFTTGS
jgi:hypothetical protein